MSVSSIRARFPALKAAALAMALAFASTAQAQVSGPFRGMAGSWEGTGDVAIGNGTTERMTCWADYQIGNAGSTAALALRCASDSYRFQMQGNVRYQNGEVLGNWSEPTRGTGGKIIGTVKGNQIEVRVDGQSFAALLSLTTKGNKQSVSIRTPSGSDMSEANITLTRRT